MNLQRHRPLSADEIINDMPSGLRAGILPEHAAAFGDHARPEGIPRCELAFALGTCGGVDACPPGGGEDDAGERVVAAEFLEHAEVLHGGAAEADIEDSVQVDDAGEADVVSVGLAEPVGDFAEDVGVGFVGVVEAGGVDEVDFCFCVVGALVDADVAGACGSLAGVNGMGEGLLAGFEGVPYYDAFGKVTDEGTFAAAGDAHHGYDYVARSA